ncbi:MAG: hypothetical protein JSV24_11880 [Bacteroidales bacterium]|nr:MAG: hypothetical protein JSV24_11880 [Bacteroidales bacterium]
MQEKIEEYRLQIKHFLNKSDNVTPFAADAFFPVDIKLSYNSKTINIRSKIAEYCQMYRGDLKQITSNHHELIKYILQGYFTETFFKKVFSQKLFPIYDLFLDEINLLTRIIHLNQPFDNKNFSALNFTIEYSKHTTDVAHILDDNIKELYLNEIKGLFVKSIEPKKSKEVFKISNYFIHFINWEKSFNNFYEITYEIMPSEIRLLENFFSPEFKTLIKAYMAFQTQVNIIKRTFEKKSPGKISTLSYFEWESDIREFLLQKFEKIFGQTKAKEYVDLLNKVISDYISRSALRS